MFDWIGQKLQDVHDGKNVYLTDEEVEQDRQAWLKTQKPVVEKKSFSSPCQQEDAEQEIEQEDKDEDEVGEEPDTEGQQDG